MRRLEEAAALRVVVDTNVWVSGLIIPDSQPGRVLDAVRRGTIEVVVTWDLARELADVLQRPRLRKYNVTDEDVRDVLLLLAPLLPAVELASPPSIRDPKDVPLVAAAITGKAKAIVSGDRDLKDDPALRTWLQERGIEVLTPVELLDRLEA